MDRCNFRLHLHWICQRMRCAMCNFRSFRKGGQGCGVCGYAYDFRRSLSGTVFITFCRIIRIINTWQWDSFSLTVFHGNIRRNSHDTVELCHTKQPRKASIATITFVTITSPTLPAAFLTMGTAYTGIPSFFRPHDGKQSTCRHNRDYSYHYTVNHFCFS